MSEHVDAGHGHFAAAGVSEDQEYDREQGHGALEAAEHAEHDLDFERFRQVEFDDGHGGHYEVTDYVVVHEHDEESDDLAAEDDGQPHAGLNAAGEIEHEVERDIEYEHFRHVEFDDGHGGHFEETDLTEFREHLEAEVTGQETGGHLRAVGAGPVVDDLNSLDSRQLDAFFGPNHEVFGEDAPGAAGGHLGRAAHDPDTWVSN